ncbi:MAG: rhodanese-like domain-containing protein [Bacteroidales bacterium]
MSKTYIILAIVLLTLAGGLIFLPKTNRSNEISPKTLAKEINDPARFLSVDNIAARMINEDPSFLVVDVRSAEEFDLFTLPNALSVPLHDIANPDWEDYLNQEEMDVIFFSNGDLYADQAWILCARKGFKNLYVMEGGLNQWFSNIMQPTAPPETAPSEEFDLYAFRQGASLYFSGGSIEVESLATKTEPVKLIKREKKTTTAGGC